MRIEYHNRGIEFWTASGCLRITFCHALDGRFSLCGKTLPLFGLTMSNYEREIAPVPKRRIRYMRDWRMTIPYLMIWNIRQIKDVVYCEWSAP